MREENVFFDLVARLREEQNVSVEQLCEGLCSRKTFSGFKNDEQDIPLLLQDILLERLGVGAETTQEYVDYEEYDRWELRHKILHNITFENIERAESLLKEYEQICDMSDNLERQFVLSQRAQIRRAQGASKEELSALFSETVSLTVHEVSLRPLKEMALSLKELNLMLEREQYLPEGPRLAQYERIVEYIETKQFDRIGKAKIYPKAVYFWCNCALNDTAWMEEQGAVSKLLERCNNAFELLRNASRMYFMWELLELREVLLTRRLTGINELSAVGEKIGTKEYRERGRVEKWQRENAKWKWVLDAVYTEFGVPKETWEYCYLYVKKGVNSYHDVVRIRRRMFGMTAKELYDGICGEAVLRGLEQKKTKTQRYNVRHFFARLGLSMELKRTELVSGDSEVKELIESLNVAINGRMWKLAEDLLVQIDQKAPIEERSNQQLLMQKTLLLQWRNGEISDTDFCERMRKTLELTLPWEYFMAEGEKYLTNTEQTCIQNMMQAMDKESETFQICVKRFEEYYAEFDENELQDAVSGMYEHIMGYVGSELGNQGNYDRSDEMNQRIIEGCLRYRRLKSLPSGLYDCYWNYVKRVERDIPVKKKLDELVELNRCILLSELGRQDERVKFYKSKK